MGIVEKSLETQLANLQERAGKSLDELFAVLEETGLEKHGELRDHLKETLGMGHGDADTLVHVYRQRGDDAPRTVEGELARIYSGKEKLREIHDRIMERLEDLGDFEISAKKSYMSLRRRKQFAKVGPATRSEVEVGLDFEHTDPPERLEAEKPGSMCRWRIRISDPDEVDDELIGWIRQAYEEAG